MKSILCYGDSNTWGADPRDISRFPFERRWTGVLQRLLGESWHVISEGLPNRTTGFDDPRIHDRNGKASFSMLQDTHYPFDYFVVMLGTNDAKTRFTHTPADAAMAIHDIISMARAGNAQTLIIAPPPIRAPIKFDEFDVTRAVPFSEALAAEYERVAVQTGAAFLDAGKIIAVSPLDGVHFDEVAHEALANALRNRISR